MSHKQIILRTQEFMKDRLLKEGSGHDWQHIFRVWKMAKEIGEKEKADLFVAELGALLHDIADWKFFKDPKAGSKESRKWLESLNVDEDSIKKVCSIVDNVSFKGSKIKSKMESLEGKIVQDADRLDALGAIGIARCFAYSGFKGIPIFDPKIKPNLNKKLSNKSTSINHFYEKLLLIKDLMNTKTAKNIATKRHKFLEDYLKQFYLEWGEK